ncbi:MAG TPA: sulfatase [Blastocatellia bacterium]|nr:sulfatase [Blastocatellia bacterium]
MARPNILFILADDLAWNDLDCYGARQAETPQIDRLAAQGMRFTQAYAAAPICSPSRAALLTGRSPARLGLEFVTKNPGATVNATGLPLEPPPFSPGLALEEITFAEVLQKSGYRTGFYGKWHVAQHYGVYLGWSPTHGPKQQGFDEAEEDFGGHSYGALAKAPLQGPETSDGEFPPDSMADKAIAFLERNKDRPFCLMVSHFFVHDPVKAPARWLFEKARRKAKVNSDKAAAYVAFVETLDHHVGRLLSALDRLGLSGNTLVVFTSDNGGAPGYLERAPLRGSKWTLYEAGLRVPFIARWPGVIAPNRVADAPIIGSDIFPTFCEVGGARMNVAALDGLSLAPLLRGKRPTQFDQRELVWHFPYYNPEPPKQGVRRPVLADPPPGTLFTPVSAIRRGRYKLLRHYENNQNELYDLASDPKEQHDLAKTRRSLARSMRARLDAKLRSLKARFPIENTNFQK